MTETGLMRVGDCNPLERLCLCVCVCAGEGDLLLNEMAFRLRPGRLKL